jgi:hypothetical protein
LFVPVTGRPLVGAFVVVTFAAIVVGVAVVVVGAVVVVVAARN